jgi:3-isopropylmalate/(R)-2-methylmalate dehydratase small subunit
MDNNQKGTCFMDKGTIFKFHNDLDTDQIIASQYLLLPNLDEMKSHTFESLDPDFSKKVKPGDFVVGGENFGCGSSREQAPGVLKALGVKAVIAKSFARIFFRNAINIGLPIIECPEAAKEIEAGDEVEVDFDSGKIYDRTKGTEYQGQAFPEFMQKLIAAGGLVNYTNHKKNK